MLHVEMKTLLNAVFRIRKNFNWIPIRRSIILMDPDDQLITDPDPDPTMIFLWPLKENLMSGSISLKFCNIEFLRKFL
jgi:hypothetical protein